MSEIVTKAQFADIVKRDPAFVSRAIGSGKIHGPALVGEGRMARICVAEALRQLGMNLDLGQQLAQAAPILPAVDGRAAGEVPPAELPLEAPASSDSQAQDLRVEQLELKNRRARLEVERIEREQLRQAGELVLASEVTAALRRQLRPLVATFDEVPAAVAKAVAETHGLSYAKTLITVKAAIRQARAAWAERALAMSREMGVPAGE